KSEGLDIPFYSSADIRDSGYKAACIDLNLFPAGFNNLCEKFADEAMDSITKVIKKKFNNIPHINVLIIPEAHSRNKFYNAHLWSLKNILEKTGLKVTVATMDIQNCHLETFDGKLLNTKPIIKKNNLLVDQSNSPFDWILLNNDLSDGEIDWLNGLNQPVIPPISFGWHKRRKSYFFKSYNNLINELAKKFDFDPWLLSAITDSESNVDFNTENGRGKIAAAVDKILLSIKKKYDEYGIKNPPRVFIKNDSGTYGMGIMVVKSPDEIMRMNRKARNKMAVGKGKQPISNVIIQEAVPTRNITNEFVTEPVVYLIGLQIIGTFLRANSERGATDNLNAKGMSFYRYCTLHPVDTPSECLCNSDSQIIYRTLGKISAIAAALEERNP
ncbi:MAG: glutamate--cysteine ligase, partial [Chlamydiae bacterium]